MKLFIVVIGILVAEGLSTSAQAQNYPWCAVYGHGLMGGSSNCGFTTYQQCQATVSGIGGFCERNNQYVPPPGPHAPRYRPHYRHYQH